MSTFTNTAREVEMPNGDVVVIHNAPTGGENTTSNIKKFKYDDNGHVTESTAADAEDLNLSGYSTPTTGSTDIGTSDDVQTAIGKLDHQSHIDQTNILYTLENGVKNLLPDAEDTVTSTRWIDYPISIPAGTYEVYIGTFSSNDTDSTISQVYFFKDTTTLNPFVGIPKKATDMHATITTNDTSTFLRIYASSNATLSAGDSITLSKVMVCEKEVWNASPSYAPHALPNYDLTYLEAQDRAGLIDVVDGGAKNLAEIPTTQTIGSITFTKDSNEWITSNSSTPDGRQWSDANKNVVYSVKAGRYIIYGETASTNTGTVDAYVIVNGNLYQPLIITANSNGTVEVNLTSAGTIGLMYKPYSSNKVRYMICTKAAFGVSNKFVPYRPNYDLVCNTLASATKITQTVNATYTLISNLTYTSTPNTIARVTAIAMNSGKVPTGIMISRSNQASMFDNASNLIAKSEASYACRQLQTDAIVTDGSATTYYIWAKVSEANSTMIKLVTQIIGYTS